MHVPNVYGHNDDFVMISETGEENENFEVMAIIGLADKILGYIDFEDWTKANE